MNIEEQFFDKIYPANNSIIDTALVVLREQLYIPSNETDIEVLARCLLNIIYDQEKRIHELEEIILGSNYQN